MPRAGLTRERVVAAAAAMADEVGLANLTLAGLAHQLGVRQPSLYKHVAGIDDVRRALALRAMAGLADDLGRATVGRSRGDAVRALATAYRQWAAVHPGLYEAMLAAPDPDDPEAVAGSARLVSLVTDVLGGFGLSDQAAIHATRALRSSLHGFVALEQVGGFGLPVDVDDSYARMVDGLVGALESPEWRLAHVSDSHVGAQDEAALASGSTASR